MALPQSWTDLHKINLRRSTRSFRWSLEVTNKIVRCKVGGRALVSFPVQYDAAQRLQKSTVSGRREYLGANGAPLPDSRTLRGAPGPKYFTSASTPLESRGVSGGRP